VPFEPKQKIFQKIREVGQEYGATTGRPRSCNWMSLDLLERAIRINGVTHVVLSKGDVLDHVGRWKVRARGGHKTFASGSELERAVTKFLTQFGVEKRNIYFSKRKDAI
jgi:adenylosuccinate synthase